MSASWLRAVHSTGDRLVVLGLLLLMVFYLVKILAFFHSANPRKVH